MIISLSSRFVIFSPYIESSDYVEIEESLKFQAQWMIFNLYVITGNQGTFIVEKFRNYVGKVSALKLDKNIHKNLKF